MTLFFPSCFLFLSLRRSQFYDCHSYGFYYSEKYHHHYSYFYSNTLIILKVLLLLLFFFSSSNHSCSSSFSSSSSSFPCEAHTKQGQSPAVSQPRASPLHLRRTTPPPSRQAAVDDDTPVSPEHERPPFVVVVVVAVVYGGREQTDRWLFEIGVLLLLVELLLHLLHQRREVSDVLRT
jgi:hypothetical protein